MSGTNGRRKGSIRVDEVKKKMATRECEKEDLAKVLKARRK